MYIHQQLLQLFFYHAIRWVGAVDATYVALHQVSQKMRVGCNLPTYDLTRFKLRPDTDYIYLPLSLSNARTSTKVGRVGRYMM